jgi:hypothetical protein
MGRPKLHDDNAAKQRAHRERLKAETIIVDRAKIESLEKQIVDLHNAVTLAAIAGEPTAQECCAASVATTLEKLTKYFTKVTAEAEKYQTQEKTG